MPSRWNVDRQDIERAVKMASKSAPGPDKLPCKVWSQLGSIGIDTLWAAAQALSCDDAENLLRDAYWDESDGNGHDFNLGTLVCLPKKPAGTLEEVGDYFTPEGNRPLSIVNTDNRIIANAARLKWEPILGAWSSKMQQGFIKGRSIIANLIDVDTEAMTISLKSDRGAIVLFDFSAAFPSISQEYIHRVLEYIGVPGPCRRLISSLYSDNKCVIACKGCLFPGFPLTAGVRQGCPLSPLLFAITADILLRTLERDCPDAIIRAFADDTAMVTPDFWKHAPKTQQIFDQYERLSGLALNMHKCVVIPIHICELQDFKTRLRDDIQRWATMTVASSGRYLGFQVGPGKGDATWNKPVAKFLQRVTDWCGLPLGLQYDALVYNTFGISVLSDVSQLEAPPKWVLEKEEEALRSAASGPGKWCVPADLWRLKESYALARSFKSLAYVSQAAQLRVFVCDKGSKYGEGFECQAAALRNLMKAAHARFSPREKWQDWYDRSFLICLADNKEELANKIPAIRDLISAAASKDHHDRTHFQKDVYELILWHTRPEPEFRIRDMLDRLHRSGLSRHLSLSVRTSTPAWTSRKCLHNLHVLSSLVAPRVASACFSTIWNRWTTRRRFQQRTSKHNQCQLGCGGDAEDSIEHYSRCARVRNFGARVLKFQSEHISLHTFLLCDPRICTEEELTKSALLIYATYRAFNHYKHAAPPTSADVHDALNQWCKEGVKGHTLSSRTLAKIWKPSAQLTPLPPMPANVCLADAAMHPHKKQRKTHQ